MSDAGVPGPPGRGRELDEIRVAIDELSTGSGGVLLLSGEGGVGKTTVSAWASEAARTAGATVLEAPCFALSADTPYAALVAAFGPLVRADIEREDGSVTRGLSSLGLLFDGFGTESDTAGDGGPSAGADSALARTRLHGAFATLLSRLTTTDPVVLVVDDLHWADPATIEVLHALTADLPDLPFLLLCTLRPFEANERTETRNLLRAWRPAPWVRTVEIGGLDTPAMAMLVQQRLGGVVPARAVELIQQRSGGTPLVAEELLEAMVDAGVLRPLGRRWELAVDDDVPVPAVADDLIGDRLGRLGSDAVSLVAAVAVAADNVTTSALATVVDRPTRELRAALDELRRTGLLDRTEVHGETAWVVHHPIIGEVATSMVGERAVADLHQRFAHRLQGAGIEIRGRHVLGAGDLAREPEDVGLLLQAGISALDRGAPEQACRLLGAALEAIDERSTAPDLLPDVLAALGRAWTRRGEFGVALHHLARAQDLVGAGDDLCRQADLLVEVHDAAWNRNAEGHDFDHQYAELRSALEAAGEWAAAHRLLSSEFMRRARRGDRLHVEEFLEASARIEREVDDPEVTRWRAHLEVVRDLEAFENGIAVLEGVDRLLDTATRAGDFELQRRALHERLDVLLLVGTRAQLAAAIRDEREFGERWGLWPTWRIGAAVWDLAIGDGDLERAGEIEDLLQIAVNFRPTGYVAVGRAISGVISGRAIDFPDLASAGEDPVVRRLAAAARFWTGLRDRTELAEEVVQAWDDGRFIAGMPIIVPVTAGLAMVTLGDRLAASQLAAHLRAYDGGAGRTSAWADVIDAEAAADRAIRAERYAAAGSGFEALERPMDAALCWLAAAEAGAAVDPERLADAAVRFESAPAPWLTWPRRRACNRWTRRCRAASRGRRRAR